MKQVAFILILLVMTGCREHTSDPTPAQDTQKSAETQEEFNLKVGETAYVARAGLAIRFKEVREDSRCPTGVTCIWEGNGRITVEVTPDGDSAIAASLNTTLDPKEITIAGSTIRLKSLAPYPHIDSPIPPQDYIATLVVTTTR